VYFKVYYKVVVVVVVVEGRKGKRAECNAIDLARHH
jgi:hypothetical protein